MISRHLYTMVMSLPEEERRELIQQLQASLMSREECASRAEWMLQILADILGLESIPYKSNERRYLYPRMMVAYQLRKEGFPLYRIGQMLHKDHATISYNIARWQDVLDCPWTYKDILPAWEEFKKRISDEKI